jgi:ankyrin repeat protein
MNAAAEFFDALKAGDVVQVETLLGRHPTLVSARHDSGLSAVLWATYHGQASLARLLVSRGAELTFFEAAAVGTLDRISAWLREEPALLNTPAPDGFSALGLAAFFGHTEVLSLLLSQGANPNAASENPTHVTPLHSAVAHRRAEVSLSMARALLEHGANPNLKQQGGYTPLHQAAHHGQDPMIELLLSHGADVSATTESGQTPLQLAEKAGHVSTAELLRSHGAA